MLIYCPKCESKLFPEDEKFIIIYGVCSYCVTWKKFDRLDTKTEDQIMKKHDKNIN